MMNAKNSIQISLLFILQAFITIPAMANVFENPVAMISNVNGSAGFENSTDRKIDFGTDIFIGDLIKTDKNSQIGITFYNGCRQETIAQDSLVQVGKDKSSIRKGTFIQVEQFDCEIPQAVLQPSDSHLKAGLVFRAVFEQMNQLSEQPEVVKNRRFNLRMWSNKGESPEYKVGESIVLYLVADADAYVSVYFYGSQGQLIDLTPELNVQDNKLKAGKLYVLGQSSGFIAQQPLGNDFIHVVASKEPIEFNSAAKKIAAHLDDYGRYVQSHVQYSFSETSIKLAITR